MRAAIFPNVNASRCFFVGFATFFLISLNLVFSEFRFLFYAALTAAAAFLLGLSGITHCVRPPTSFLFYL